MPAATKQQSLKEMRAAHPAEWEKVQADIARVTGTGDIDDLKAYVQQVSQGRGRSEIERAMAVEALRKVCVSAATGVTKGKVRFNLFNG